MRRLEELLTNGPELGRLATILQGGSLFNERYTRILVSLRNSIQDFLHRRSAITCEALTSSVSGAGSENAL
jgi:hypothetical protein